MICKKCGNEIEENEKFCGQCGRRIHQKATKKGIVFLSIGICLVIIYLILVYIWANFSNKNKIYNSSNVNLSQESTKVETKLSIVDEENKELKIKAKDLINSIINAEKERADEEREGKLFYYTSKLIESSTNYSIYAIGSSSLHGALVDYPFLIIENRETGNIARICIYYAYKKAFGNEFNSSSVEQNYSLLYRALNNMGQQELVSAIKTIRDNCENGDSNHQIVKGLDYGSSEGSKNSYGNLKGMYLMIGTTMNSLE